MSEPKLPEVVYFVQAIPPEDEVVPYYGRVLSKLYRDRRGVTSWINANSRRKHKIYRAFVTWEEVD